MIVKLKIEKEVSTLNNSFIPDEVKERVKNLNYEFSKDMADLPSRKNGFIGGSLGGTMTRRLVEMAEKDLADRNN